MDSLGAHLNNCENPSPRTADDWYAASIELKRPYKFSIAAENATSKGYTSEKIMTSLKAHSIPIYGGNPNVSRDFNPKSFINCHDYPNLDALLKYIKKIDNDDDLWIEMISQPHRTEDQKNLYDSDNKKFNAFLRNIFDQYIQDASRAPKGAWPQILENTFFSRAYPYPQAKKTKIVLGGLIKITKFGSEKHTTILWGLIRKERHHNKNIIKIFNYIIFSYTSG